MTDARIKEIGEFADRMALVQNKTGEERKMIVVIRELLGSVSGEVVSNKAEYDRGYKAGVHDERDRAYEAKKAAKAKPVEAPAVEEDVPFGVEDL